MSNRRRRRVGTHTRNTGPMLASPRCGARTRSGGTCHSPAVHGKRRCRMHGGAKGSGARLGNQNARKHGTFGREAKQQRAAIREAQALLRKILSGSDGD
jgi:glucans biosynthesis protein